MGAKVVVNVCDPALRAVPAAGEYVKLPATGELASSCIALRAVPCVMAAGVAQVMAGVALLTVTATVAVALV